MLIISHELLGGVIGQAVNNPWVAFPIGVVSHFLADKIPHYWPKNKKHSDIYAAFDVVISLALVPVYFSFGFTNSSFWYGFLGSSIIDIVLVGIPFINKSKLGVWHDKRQPHQDNLIFIFSDIFLFLVSLIILILIK